MRKMKEPKHAQQQSTSNREMKTILLFCMRREFTLVNHIVCVIIMLRFFPTHVHFRLFRSPSRIAKINWIYCTGVRTFTQTVRCVEKSATKEMIDAANTFFVHRKIHNGVQHAVLKCSSWILSSCSVFDWLLARSVLNVLWIILTVKHLMFIENQINRLFIRSEGSELKKNSLNCSNL